jgi:hypothetical protein
VVVVVVVVVDRAAGCLIAAFGPLEHAARTSEDAIITPSTIRRLARRRLLSVAESARAAGVRSFNAGSRFLSHISNGTKTFQWPQDMERGPEGPLSIVWVLSSPTGVAPAEEPT